MDARAFEQILNAQQNVLEDIAFNPPLPQTLCKICLLIESLLDDPAAKASILLLEGERLATGAAPSLPDDYCDAIDGVVIGPQVGSCGTACYRNEQVIVSDIATDPLWADFKDAALANGLRACWSTPVRSSQEEVLASFAIYYTDVKQPMAEHMELIERFCAIASVAIERAHASEREQQLLNRIRETNNRFKGFSRVMSELAFVLDHQGHCVDIFGNTNKLYQHADPKTLIGQKVSDVLPDDLGTGVLNIITKTLTSGLQQVMEYSLETRHGLRYFEGRAAPINDYLQERPERPHVVWMAIDITDHKHAEREIQRLAYYDELTELPNRRLLLDRLQQAVKKVRRLKKYSALLYLDVDDFKPINDVFGHSVGDDFLRQLARRLTTVIRNTDTIARMGGDEFIVLLDSYHASSHAMQQIAEEVATKLMECFHRPFMLGDQTHPLSASLGICVFDHRIQDHEAVLRHADQAMYLSKQKPGNHFSFYDPAQLL